MSKNPTIKDIAREANVSIATVSRYLNSSGHIDESTAKNIAEIIKRLDYRPNRLARGLKTNYSRNIILVVPDIQNPFYSKMSTEIQNLLLNRGYIMTLFNTDGKYEMEQKSINIASDIGADGILFAAAEEHKSIIDELKKTNIPTVTINAYEKDIFDTVYADREKSTYIATKYLISKGHKKIGFVGGIINNLGSNRKSGYLKALNEAGIPFDEELVFEMRLDSNTGIKSGYYFSSMNSMPSAICCGNDAIALGLLKSLHYQGISVPDNVSVTGVDNIIYSELCFPGLTTITNDSAEYAKYAVSALFDRMNGTYSGEPRRYEVNQELVLRDSTCQFNK